MKSFFSNRSNIEFVVLAYSLLFSFSCADSDRLAPNYNNYKNDLERHHLEGSVKKVEVYKIFTSDVITTDRAPFLLKSTLYNKKGYVLNESYFDENGAQLHELKNKYKADTLLIESISHNPSVHYRAIQLFSYDSLVQNYRIEQINNDTLKISTEQQFDKNGRVTLTKITDKDSVQYLVTKWKYDKNGAPERKQMYAFSPSDSTKFNSTKTTYRYTSNNKIAFETNYSIYGDSTTTQYEYDNKGFVIEKTYFTNGQKIEKNTFDPFHNILLTTHFFKDEIVREERFEYDYDAFGNWIEKKALLQNRKKEVSGWQSIYIETRNIEYY